MGEVVAVGDEITAAHYNDLRTRIIALAGTYGVTTTMINTYLGAEGSFDAVTAGETLNNVHFDKAFAIYYWLRVHQLGSADVGLPTNQPSFTEYNEGDAILAGDGYVYDENGEISGPRDTITGYNDLQLSLEIAEGMAGVHAANQFTNPATSAQAGDVSPTDWGGGTNVEVVGGAPGDQQAGDNARGRISREFSITFSSTANRDRFFNMGGELIFSVRLTNSSGVPYTSPRTQAKRNWWYNHLNVSNPIDFRVDRSIFNVLGTGYTQFVLKLDSTNTLYEMNQTKVELKRNAANTVITAKVTCSDYDRSLKDWPDDPRDENVNAGVASWVSVKTVTAGTNPLFNTVGANPSVTNVTNPTWTVSTITDVPPLVSSPPIPSIGPFNSGDTNGTTWTRTFTIPAENWAVKVRGVASKAGASNWTFFGLLRGSPDIAGTLRIRIFLGSNTSGTELYNSGILTGNSAAAVNINWEATLLKTGAAAQNYTVEFTSYVSSPDATTSTTVIVEPTFAGFA